MRELVAGDLPVSSERHIDWFYRGLEMFYSTATILELEYALA